MSPPCVPKRWWLSSAIKFRHIMAISRELVPASDGAGEKPYRGKEGTTTWNASSGSPPCAPGSASNGMICSISMNDRGQPWVRMSGNGDGPLPRWRMKWMSDPFTVAICWERRFSRVLCVPVKAMQPVIMQVSPCQPRSSILATPTAMPALIFSAMFPTLNDGDDIMVDRSAASRQVSDGIYVLRRDDTLMVKRITVNPSRASYNVSSDNSAYASWSDCAPGDIDLLGRVVWAGRRIR